MYPVKLITLKEDIVPCVNPREKIACFERYSKTVDCKLLYTEEPINKHILPVMQWCSTRVTNETLYRQSYGLEGAETITEYIAVDFKESKELSNYVDFYIRENSKIHIKMYREVKDKLEKVKLDLVGAEFSANSKQRRLDRISEVSFWTRFKWLFTGVKLDGDV